MSIVSIVAIHEAQLSQESLLNQAFFCWSVWQIQGIRLNICENLWWELFHPYVKHQIARIQRKIWLGQNTPLSFAARKLLNECSFKVVMKQK